MRDSIVPRLDPFDEVQSESRALRLYRAERTLSRIEESDLNRLEREGARREASKNIDYVVHVECAELLDAGQPPESGGRIDSVDVDVLEADGYENRIGGPASKGGFEVVVAIQSEEGEGGGKIVKERREIGSVMPDRQSR